MHGSTAIVHVHMWKTRCTVANGISIEAVVGLERIIFTVSEDVGVVELCARVFEPDIDCPIEFPFNIILSSTDRTAGTYLIVTY